MPPLTNASGSKRIWFQRTLLGLDESACDGHATGGDGSFVVADGTTLADVIVEFERASERSRVIAAASNSTTPRRTPRAGDVSLRFIYLRAQHPARPVRRSTPSHAPSADTSDLALPG